MEQFRTELPITPAPSIDHASGIVTTGSCFSDNIGQKLSENKFRVTVNPLGTCYNPISIHKGLMGSEPGQEMFVESEGLWKHFDYHSKFTGKSKEDLQDVLSRRTFPAHSDVVIITYGTSWVYRHKASGNVVANCHKRPQSEFQKELLTVDAILESFVALSGLQDRKIILTLSPVRHLKDSLELNSVSKSILRQAIYQIQKTFSNVDYFPAYEIMMDDLRDYRFYEPDMIHPSRVAIDYIWEKFTERYFSENTKSLIGRWQSVSRSINHRAFNGDTDRHRNFLRKLLADLGELKNDMDVTKEIEEIERRINA